MGSWVTTAVKLTEDDFQAAPRLKLRAADERRLRARRPRRWPRATACRWRTFGDAMASVVAEHTLLLILAVYRRLLQLDAAVRSGAWRTQRAGAARAARQARRPDRAGLYRPRGRRCGCGRSGPRSSYFARHACRRRRARLGSTICRFDELLARSDIVSLHVPLAPSTRGLIGAARARPDAARRAC